MLFYEKQSETDKHNESLFNMDIYEVLIEAMCNIEAGTDADLRPFRCLWEHKKLMLERIKHLSFNEYSDCWVYSFGKYDKAVMAALILKAEVVDENRLNVVWKHQDIYEKIFSIL